MPQRSTESPGSIANWHVNLLIAAACFSVLLIAMGGILCVTQSIRNCPDWPGCFGKFIPPAEPGPILEYTHRFLAAVSAFLILGAAIAGIVRTRQLRWIAYPPVIAFLLLLEVSYFGAQVVLHGLSPGWATLDVGSALLVVALMVASAEFASAHQTYPTLDNSLAFKSVHSRLALAATAVVYIVLVSGILVSGKNSITACLGWPVYSRELLQLDGHLTGNVLRWILSLVGIVVLVALFRQGWKAKLEKPVVFDLTRWMGIALLLEALLQAGLLVFGHRIFLLVPYTVTAAVFWALLVALMVRISLDRGFTKTG